MKYDTQLTEVTKLLPSSKNILIALPTEAEVDGLAAGLALFLSLEQAGKQALIVTEGVIRVGHTNLFGVGKIQNKLPKASGGNLTITLGGVVAPDKTVPALQNLDWAPTGAEMKDLKLVFHVLPGQKFEPSFITPAYEGGGFDLIFTIGADNLNLLGSIYTGNTQVFSGSHIVNIDNKASNTQFGTSNIIDTGAACLSEIIPQILPALNLPYEGDIATNVLSGIFAATTNLQGSNVGADTYAVVGQALQVGGEKPISNVVAPVVTPQHQQDFGSSNNGFDLTKIFNAPVNISNSEHTDNFPVPTVVSSGVEQKIDVQSADTVDTPSIEEVPMGEGVETVSPEADWLTPKIFTSGKGSSLG